MIPPAPPPSPFRETYPACLLRRLSSGRGGARARLLFEQTLVPRLVLPRYVSRQGASMPLPLHLPLHLPLPLLDWGMDIPPPRGGGGIDMGGGGVRTNSNPLLVSSSNNNSSNNNSSSNNSSSSSSSQAISPTLSTSTD